MTKLATQTQRKPSVKGIRLGPFFFAPGLIPSIVTLLLFSLLVNLGLWQLRRADAKQEILQRQEDRSQLPEIDLAQIEWDNPSALADRPARATGRFLDKPALLLDNRTHNGQPGYEILTPLITEGKLLWVNHGWRPQGKTRQDLPTLPETPQGDVTVSGKAHLPNPNFFVLKEDDYQQVRWPKIIQKIDLEKTAQLFDHPVIPIVLRLNPQPGSGWVREWQSVTRMGPEKHYGYALQWLSLALALLIIYVVVNTTKKTTLP